jgi:hypothetical protein
VEEDSSLFLHEISHDVFTFGTERKDREIVPLWPVVPRFEDYSDKEKQSPTSQFTTREVTNLYMIVTNQVLSWMCRISKNRLLGLILCSLSKIILRKSSLLDLPKTLSNKMKRRFFPRVLFMMIMNLTLGRAKKKNQKNQRSNRRSSLSPVQNLLMSSHHLRSVILYRLITLLYLPERFNHV